MHLLRPPGIGKSHPACALGVATVKAGKSVYRCTLAELIDSLALTHRAGQMGAKLSHYTRASLLVVNEISYLLLPKEGANYQLRAPCDLIAPEVKNLCKAPLPENRAGDRANQ